MFEINLVKRVCTKCKVLKGYDFFNLHSKAGIDPKCRECYKIDYNYGGLGDKKRLYSKNYYFVNKETLKPKLKTYYINNKEKKKINAREFRKRMKDLCFEHYGKICIWCGEDDLKTLEMDHINNDGNRKEVYSKIVKAGFPNTFQSLCSNCNHAKLKNKGVMPNDRKDRHRTQRTDV